MHLVQGAEIVLFLLPVPSAFEGMKMQEYFSLDIREISSTVYVDHEFQLGPRGGGVGQRVHM